MMAVNGQIFDITILLQKYLRVKNRKRFYKNIFYSNLLYIEIILKLQKNI